VAKLGVTYLHYRLLGAVFLLLNMVYRGFFSGVGSTKQVMTSAIIVTVTNILLDYMLIFGHAGLPQMGIAGAAIASTIATGIGTTYFVIISLLGRYRKSFSPYCHLLLAIPWFAPIFRLSLPVIAQRFIANGSFFVFFSIVSRIGTLELAASNVIRSICSGTPICCLSQGDLLHLHIGSCRYRLGAPSPHHVRNGTDLRRGGPRNRTSTTRGRKYVLRHAR
jgi:Na+-driven multidrug efflux pump